MLLTLWYAGNRLQQIININSEKKDAFPDFSYPIHVKLYVKNRLNSTDLRFILLLFLYTYVNKNVT